MDKDTDLNYIDENNFSIVYVHVYFNEKLFLIFRIRNHKNTRMQALECIILVGSMHDEFLIIN